jgi:DNA-binding IclR family transcriptional regulator
VTTSADDTAGAGALARGLRLLRAIGEAEARGDSAGVVRLGELTGIEKSRASRILRELTEIGLVERDASTREFRLGVRMLALAARAGEPALTQESRALLRSLVADYGESAYLHALVDGTALTIRAEPSQAALHVAARPGEALPLWRAAGRALLLGHSRHALSDASARVDFSESGVGAPHSAVELIARVGEDASRGMAVGERELDEDVLEIAVPVRLAPDDIVASLSLSGPAFRFRPALSAAAAALREAASDLGRRTDAARAERRSAL